MDTESLTAWMMEKNIPMEVIEEFEGIAMAIFSYIASYLTKLLHIAISIMRVFIVRSYRYSYIVYL